MRTSKPPKVENVEDYWVDKPPEISLRCLWWLARIEKGFTPNRRLRSFGREEAAEFYGVYIWEYLNLIHPAMSGQLSLINLESDVKAMENNAIKNIISLVTSVSIYNPVQNYRVMRGERMRILTTILGVAKEYMETKDDVLEQLHVTDDGMQEWRVRPAPQKPQSTGMKVRDLRKVLDQMSDDDVIFIYDSEYGEEVITDIYFQTFNKYSISMKENYLMKKELPSNALGYWVAETER